jgi:hypothetical protein
MAVCWRTQSGRKPVPSKKTRSVISEMGKIIIIIIIIIITIFINCKWVDTRWQWLFYMYTECDIDYY